MKTIPENMASFKMELQELRKENAELKESETLYKTLVDNAFDAIYLLKGKHYQYVNPRYCEITGYSSEEATSPDFDYNVTLPDETKE